MKEETLTIVMTGVFLGVMVFLQGTELTSRENAFGYGGTVFILTTAIMYAAHHSAPKTIDIGKLWLALLIGVVIYVGGLVAHYFFKAEPSLLQVTLLTESVMVALQLTNIKNNDVYIPVYILVHLIVVLSIRFRFNDFAVVMGTGSIWMLILAVKLVKDTELKMKKEVVKSG